MKNVKASPILERSSIIGREGHPLHLSELCATPGQPNKNGLLLNFEWNFFLFNIKLCLMSVFVSKK